MPKVKASAAAVGRPTKYKPEFAERLIELCKQGLSRRALCAELEVSANTFYTWVKEHKEFRDAYETGEAIASDFYEKAMLNGGMGKIKGFNVMALTFLMKNRYPREFRDRQDIELSGKDGGPIQTAHTSQESRNLTDQELKERLKEILKS